MYDSKRTVAVLFVAMTVVGLSIAPVASVAAPLDGPDIGQQTTDLGPNTQANESGPFPEEICTDLLAMAHEEMPYDQIIWVDDLPESVPRDIPGKDQLPEEVRPPGIPWSVITPSAIGGIIVGATPSHCEVQNPNDLSYNPIQDNEDNLDPDAGGDVQPGETGEALVIVNGTLDQTSQGPSGVAEADLELTENGTIDPNARLNDGEKDYGVDPGLQYWSDGTTFFETDVYVFGTRVGVENDCFGEECNTRLRGLPTFFDLPALPSHTDRERPNEGGSDDGSDEGTSGGENGTDDGTDADDGSSDGTGTTGGDGSGTGSDGTPDSPDGANDGGNGSADDAGDGSNDGGSADDGGSDGNDGGDGDDGQNSGGDGGDAGGDENTGGAANQQQQANNDGNQGAQQAAAADGSGLGVVVALIVFVVGAAAVAPRD